MGPYLKKGKKIVETRLLRNSLLRVILGIVNVRYGIRFDSLYFLRWPQTLPLLTS